MKKRIVSEVTIECDPPRVPFWLQQRGPEAVAGYYEEWIKEFDEFIRDHRSQDPVRLSVEREYKDVCSHCGYEWDEDDAGVPCCCANAVSEYEAERAKSVAEQLASIPVDMPQEG